MMSAPFPVDEASRVAQLRLLSILDTEPEERFDRLTRLAKRLFSVPMAMVSLVDADRQWFKSSVGAAHRESPRDRSFCAHAILGDEVFTVSDTALDQRFVDNPLVSGEPGIRFYAGCPLTVGDSRLGTLCVIDDKPREFGEEERQLLRDLAEMVERELIAVQLATFDELTTVSSRRGFEALARHALNACKRMERPATLLYFDLNDFKPINDRYGHAEGDRALKTFAQGLLAVFRESDVIGRLGGDEFAVLLTGTPGEEAVSAVARLRTWIQADGRAEGRSYPIDFSVGQFEFDPGHPRSIEELLAQADAAMYEAKRTSRSARVE
jgi:diguanylate cyclase (GGDEF)-like protein